MFLGVLGVFFLNLAAVLAVRLGPTWRRIALRPRAEDGLKAWARMEESLAAALPEGFGVGTAARALRGFGYQSRKVGEHTLWGVKHRTAPLGFLLGIMFPKGVAHLEGSAPRLVPWAWGVNGTMSVISAVGSALLALTFGFTPVILAGAACYALCIPLTRRTVVTPPA